MHTDRFPNRSPLLAEIESREDFRISKVPAPLPTALANPSLARVGRSPGLTAFERDVLPGFTRWLVAEIERRRPDVLIPVETKGARVLEAALRYAAEELGTPIAVPVLYGIALAYIDRARLAELRLLIIDDAVRTGANLEHHLERARNYGARDVQAITCIGDSSQEHDDVECYLSVDEDVYQQYVSQLAELVVVRGLPPEVDHHIFEVRLPVRVAGAWEELQRLLSRFGTLTIDGPESKRDEILGMTLHFPRLPAGKVHEEGERQEIDKLRFFPDLANNCFYAIPVRFPALRLPVGTTATAIVPKAEARAEVERLLPRSTNPAHLLIEEAKTLNAKTLFRAISTGAELESIIGFAAVLRQRFPGAEIEAHPESFARLYGAPCGARVAARVSDELRAPGLSAADAEALAGEAVEPRFFDQEVIDTTRRIVAELRRMYESHRADPDHDPAQRVGLSIPEIVAYLDDADRLLVSRSIDFGMAMTTLVPFTGFEQDDDTCVQRKYRVSEGPRGGELEEFMDRGDARVEVSEQTAALLCHNLIERCETGRGSVTSSEMALLVAIMRPLVLADQSIPLTVRPADDHVFEEDEEPPDLVPQVMLRDDEQPVCLEERASSSSYLDAPADDADGHLRPSPLFKELYLDGQLAVALRPGVEVIEARMKILLSLLEPLAPEDRDPLLRGWAMSTDMRLGLTHVRHSLDTALGLLEKPLRLIRRAAPHVPSGGLAADVDACHRAAERKIELLRESWEKPGKDKWERPSLRLERAAVNSMAAPQKPLSLYQLPGALGGLIDALGLLVERLDQASAELWLDEEGDGQAASRAAELALGISAQVRQRLTSLSEDPADRTTAPPDAREAVELAARELLGTVRLVKAFLAAVTGVYRGPRDARLAAPELDKRNSSVLSLDIAGSRLHESEHPQTHNLWKNEGLDIAAQWGRALCGREGKHREGDDLWFEFAVGDSAVIAAACIQAQAAALASTEIDSISRTFHAGVDAGELEQGSLGSTNGPCMDRVTKIAKAADRTAKTTHVFISPEAWKHCSAGLRDGDVRVAEWEGEVRLDDERTTMSPIAVDAERLLRLYCERLAQLAEMIGPQIEAATEAERPIEATSARAAADEAGQAAAG